MHHPTVRLIPSAMFCLLLLFLAHDARAEEGVPVPLQ